MIFYITPWAAEHHESATLNVAQLAESIVENAAFACLENLGWRALAGWPYRIVATPSL
ncbi:protein of unknown function [Candidatus Methylomirabilis oxygeniifera]|uniref:Uncharacterized protein n=1 Tax=Methylomirabilis oxygeniifera TaxID=671143 RepID=D5MJ82_METO1|nr:protein of unknown function [Candidatus Methylomirabilis oxyfera]